MGNDLSVIEAAKTSTRGILDEVEEKETYGLINYLMKCRHGTPFEHNAMKFLICAPIFVWREWHRHRIGFSYNETSGRYRQLEPVFYVPPPERKLVKVQGYKSARPMFENTSVELNSEVVKKLTESYEMSYQKYEELLSRNIDNGLARACLPVGIYSTCYVTCNARSLMAFLSLRVYDENSLFPSYALQEIENAALQVEKIFAEKFPLVYKAFCENRRVGP